MKKNSLLKALGITFLIIIILSWIIPVGTFSGSEYAQATGADKWAPIGLFDLGFIPLITIGTFIQYGIVVLVMGGFYGILNKTGAYNKLVQQQAKFWEGKEKIFLILVICLSTLFISLTGLVMPFFIIMPYLYAIMYRLGFDKWTAGPALLGSIFAGLIGTTYGTNNTYIFSYLGLDVSYGIWSKIALLIIVTGLLIFYIMKSASKDLETVPEESQFEVPLYDKNSNTERSVVPLLVIGIISFLVIVLSTFTWYYTFEMNFFNNLFDKITGFTIREYPFFAHLIGAGTSPFGYWGNYETAVILLLSSIVIGFTYGLKTEEIVKSFGEGAKKMLGVAFYIIMANIIFTIVLNATSGTMILTIVNYLTKLTDGFNVIVASLITVISSIFYNDFYYLLENVGKPLTEIYTNVGVYPVFAVILQAFYGITMLVAPVSLFLMGGLKFFDISYKNWIKYIWKYAVTVTVISIIVSLVLIIL